MKESSIYSRQTVEFVTVAAEYCAFIEKANQLEKAEFVDKCVKLLPLLYLKAILLPETEFGLEEEVERVVSEENYEYIRSTIGRLLGAQDDYLEVFIEDMQYSENPIAANISEDLADIYQDLKDFIAVFSQGYEPTMNEALTQVSENFKSYWGQKLVNAMRPLNSIRFNEDEEEENYPDHEEKRASNRIFNAQKERGTDGDEWENWNGE
ncbi:MAG: DUF5063 domain-containing protein [Bacteroidales bacterium]